MRLLLKKLILWALAADGPPVHDPAGLDRIARQP